MSERQSTGGAGKLVATVGAGIVLASSVLMTHVGKWESGNRRVLTVYADKLAGGLPTVCHGLTRHVTTTPIIVGERWTDEKCEAEERRAMIEKVQIPLSRCLPANTPQSVFDALSSHAWNVGVAKTCGSVAAQHARRGDFRTACERIAHNAAGQPVWSTASGQFVRGLYFRRLDERKLCLRDVR
jgi:lysozyme